MLINPRPMAVQPRQAKPFRRAVVGFHNDGLKNIGSALKMEHHRLRSQRAHSSRNWEFIYM